MAERIVPRDLIGMEPTEGNLLALYLHSLQNALPTGQAIPNNERKIVESIKTIGGAGEFHLERLLDSTGHFNVPTEIALADLIKSGVISKDDSFLRVDPSKMKSIERSLSLTQKGTEVLEQAAKAAVLVLYK